MQTRTVLKANLAPRDAADALTSIALGVVLVAVIAGLPSVVVWFATDSVRATLAVGFTCALILHMQCVTALEVSDSGLRFIRLLGSPKLIPWSELSSVRAVDPVEVVVWGWCLPPFPAREMSLSFSMHGYFAIRWRNRTAYFPPANREQFVELVVRRRGQACATVADDVAPLDQGSRIFHERPLAEDIEPA